MMQIMISNRRLLVYILAIFSAAVAAVSQKHQALTLPDVQRLLRTDLDNELAKIAHDDSSAQGPARLLDTSSLHSKQHHNVRRRSVEWTDRYENSIIEDGAGASTAVAVEIIWNNLVQHAWDTAESIHRTAIGSFTKRAGTEEERIPCPFLVCTMDRHENKRQRNDDYEQIISTFNKEYEQSLLVKSSHNETCGVLTLTTTQAEQGIATYKGEQRIIAMPLLDVMKIHSGTIDEVSSLGWSVPFANQSNTSPLSTSTLPTNVTERLNQWERLIIVDFAPGLGGMKEESQLLDVVNDMVRDIQDMAEVGWLHRLNEQERKLYDVDESVALVPTLSEMFSLTASLNGNGGSNHTNARVSFWNEAFEHGIESEHACSEMFSTLFVKPRSGYYSFDMILNPADGPPPSDYDSSASNPACVASLIAGLSIHPYVLSVKSNFPIYYGWHIANKIDSHIANTVDSLKM